MSINVTVHGNPVSVCRGKMVTYDADAEFDRRRKIRLQQVRQQSKEIAANVRNRVRKEKEKQLTSSEKQGEQDLKRWQTRKLLTLQQQYRDCVKEVGSAHTRAALERDPAEILTEIGEKNQNEAAIRAKHAREKHNKDEMLRQSLASKPIEQVKLARKIENTRSAMVTKLATGKLGSPRKKKKRKKGVDITIMNNTSSRSCSELSGSDVENFSSPKRNSKSKKSKADQLDSSCSSCQSKSPKNISITSSNFDSDYDCDIYSPQSKRSKSPEKRGKSPEKHRKSPETQPKTPEKHRKSPEIQRKSPKKYNKTQEQRNKTPEKHKNRSASPETIKELINQHRPLPLYSTNTQISDRIRQRHLTEFDSDDETNGFHFISNDISAHNSPAKPNKLNIESYKICDIKSSKSKNDLPYVPTTTVRPGGANLNANEHPVQYYDHPNRFTKEYNAGAIVQKINKDSIHVDTCDRNETDEMLGKMRKHDRDAHSRGVKAMEKVKIQKDYKQLLEELPVLQKQERMAQIRTHNPKFHMDEDRLRDLERRRQAQIENIFEKYVHKCKNLETPIITIQPKQKSPPNEDLKIPFRALDVTDSALQLNVGAWTTEECTGAGRKSNRANKPEPTSSRSEKSTSSESKDDLASKQKTLADLLQRVNNQRDLLLKEVSDLPPSSNLNNILQDDELFKLLCPCPQEKNAKHFVSTATSPLLIKAPSVTEKIKTRFRKKERSPNSTSSSGISEKKKSKKDKSKKTLLIRNSETQTSPLGPFCVSSKVNNVDKENEINKENTDKLCEIIIKMAEETKIKIGAPENSNLITIDKTDGKSKKIQLTSDCNQKTSISNDNSSSTTYMSPPEIQSHYDSSKSNKSKSYKDYLHNKPQQTNLDSQKPTTSIKSKSIDVPTYNNKEINPQLMKYIKKLLSMSRQTIDEMAVSSVSEVSTPGPSVLETSGNNSPLAQLQNVMNHFELSFSDVQKYLSISETSVDDTQRPKSPSISQPTSPKPHQQTPKSFDVTTKPRDACSKLCDASRRSYDIPPEIQSRERSPQTHITSKSRDASPKSTKTIEPTTSSFKSREHSPKSRVPSPKLHEHPSVSTDDTHNPRYLFATRESPPKQRVTSPKSRGCVDNYNAPCTEALNNKKHDLLQLQADIEKLVKESFGLNAQTRSELPYSTVFDRYTELTQATCEKISNLTAMIDKVRLEKEKIISPLSSDKNENSLTSYMDLPPGISHLQRTDDLESSSGSSVSQDAVDRYLLAIGSPTTSPTVTKGTIPTQTVTVSDEEIEIEPYVPMLQGIPKYIEDTQQACENVLKLLDPKINQFLANNKHKPPPSLLRRNNANIDMVPHELSTIIELDTVVSSKNVSNAIRRRSKSPESKRTSKNTSEVENVSNRNASISDKSDFDTISPERYQSPNEEVEMSTKSKKKSPKKVQKKPQNDKIKSEMSGIQPFSSDKSSSPEDMELILRDLGLQWAVATLKKTQEAMALSPSSSETSLNKQVEKSSSSSEVSLKEVLSRQFLKRSLYISDSSRSIEIANISDFAGAIQSRDRSVQRTSTPVQHSRSSNSKNNDNLFGGDSDLSSVKLHNSDDMFLSIPNVSLDTNISLNKTKK